MNDQGWIVQDSSFENAYFNLQRGVGLSKESGVNCASFEVKNPKALKKFILISNREKD